MFHDQVTEFPHCSLTTGPRQQHACRLPYRRMRIGNGNRPADQTHRTKIVDVVAQICSTVARDADVPPASQRTTWRLSSTPCRTSTPSLAARAWTTGLISLDTISMRYANRPQPLDAEAVGPADPDRLPAILRDRCGVIGVHAVEVGDHRIDIDLMR